MEVEKRIITIVLPESWKLAIEAYKKKYSELIEDGRLKEIKTYMWHHTEKSLKNPLSLSSPLVAKDEHILFSNKEVFMMVVKESLRALGEKDKMSYADIADYIDLLLDNGKLSEVEIKKVHNCIERQDFKESNRLVWGSIRKDLLKNDISIDEREENMLWNLGYLIEKYIK